MYGEKKNTKKNCSEPLRSYIRRDSRYQRNRSILDVETVACIERRKKFIKAIKISLRELKSEKTEFCCKFTFKTWNYIKNLKGECKLQFGRMKKFSTSNRDR